MVPALRLSTLGIQSNYIRPPEWQHQILQKTQTLIHPPETIPHFALHIEGRTIFLICNKIPYQEEMFKVTQGF